MLQEYCPVIGGSRAYLGVLLLLHIGEGLCTLLQCALSCVPCSVVPSTEYCHDVGVGDAFHITCYGSTVLPVLLLRDLLVAWCTQASYSQSGDWLFGYIHIYGVKTCGHCCVCNYAYCVVVN
ncbi:hypothetical protein COO60DRAFT_204436 [Scenedesmus sp. NREL 46B-D3]|nr:hypothetical protein COO60DRAFT_204436 [Scenedesmus sp. NREL 46B-D3]